MTTKEWFIEQSPLLEDFFVYSITEKSFLGIKYKNKEYVMYTTSDGQNDFDWKKTFTYKKAIEFVEAQK